MRQVLLYSLLAVMPAAAAQGGKISPDLQSAAGSVDVIVQFTSTPSAQQHNAVEAKGGALKAAFGTMKAAAYTVSGSAIPGIASLPDVTYVSPDRPVSGKLDYSAAAVNAPIAWRYGWSGRAVGIAIIDSGIAEDNDYRAGGVGPSRVVYREAFGNLHDAVDQYGHGSHVAGIAAGDGSLSQGKFVGIAPKANLINLRVLDGQGSGADSAVIAAIARAIDLKDVYNIRVINLSLGRPVYESYRQDPLCQAVEAAWKAGIVVVAAAGNDGRDNTGGRQGYATIDAPGDDPYVITVGAMKTMGTYAREDDLIASYSSKGPTALDHVVKPDLVAPGNLVVSTMGNGNLYLPATYPQNSLGKNYFRLSGTSMAAPVVAGAAALLLEQNPSLTPDQIKARLMKTATKTFPATSCATDPQTGLTYCSVYDLFTVGAGYLDINAAMTSTDIAAKPALSPAVTLNPATGTVSLVQDSPSVWDSSAIWGSSVVWGGRGISGASVVWGGRTVWGDSLLDGFRTVWSDSVVWGGIHSAATSIWGEN